MIILYILGGVLLFIAVFISFIVSFYHIRYYFLIQKTGVYEVLNEFVNTEEFIQESNYVGGDIEKRRLLPIEMKFDSFFNPTQMEIMLIQLPTTKRESRGNIYVLGCNLEKKW